MVSFIKLSVVQSIYKYRVRLLRSFTSDHRSNTCEFVPWYQFQILKFQNTSTKTRGSPHVSSSSIKCSSHDIAEKLTTVTINTCNKNLMVPAQDLDFQCHISWYFLVFNDLRQAVIVRFVDIGGSFYHHCLNILFIMISK